MWEATHSINQEADDILTDTSSLSSDKLSTSHSLDSATDLLDLEDGTSIDTTRHSIVPSLQYNCYQPIVMGSKRKDDDSTAQSFKSSTETVLDSRTLLKTSWSDYGPGPVNLSDLFPSTPDFFHSIQKSDTSANLTFSLSSQHMDNDDNTGDFNNAMGELATLMLGCSILLNNNTDKVAPMDSSNDLKKRTTTHSPTCTASSFDFCFPPNGSALATNDQTQATRTNPQEHQSNPPNTIIPNGEACGEPNQASIYHRKILPLPKRILKKGQTLNYESTAKQQSIPASSQFTFRSPLASSTTHTNLKGNKGSAKLFTTTDYHYDDTKQPTKDNDMPCDYTKKPKRDETCHMDQGNRTITYNLTNNNQSSNQVPAIASDVIPTTLLKSSPSSKQPIPPSNRTKPNQQRLPSERKKKKKGADTNKQPGKQQANLSRRRKSSIIEPTLEGRMDTLDIVNTISNDWICLFCQYEIFKVGWAKRIQATRRQKRHTKPPTPTSQVNS